MGHLVRLGLSGLKHKSAETPLRCNWLHRFGTILVGSQSELNDRNDSQHQRCKYQVSCQLFPIGNPTQTVLDWCSPSINHVGPCFHWQGVFIPSPLQQLIRCDAIFNVRFLHFWWWTVVEVAMKSSARPDWLFPNCWFRLSEMISSRFWFTDALILESLSFGPFEWLVDFWRFSVSLYNASYMMISFRFHNSIFNTSITISQLFGSLLLPNVRVELFSYSVSIGQLWPYPVTNQSCN